MSAWLAEKPVERNQHDPMILKIALFFMSSQSAEVMNLDEAPVWHITLRTDFRVNLQARVAGSPEHHDLRIH